MCAAGWWGLRSTHCNTLQHVATCRNTLQHTLHTNRDLKAGCCPMRTAEPTLQLIATRCNALQHAVTHCNTIQHAATQCKSLQHNAAYCSTLQIGASTHAAARSGFYCAHCNTLQHTATHCNKLHRTATNYKWTLEVVLLPNEVSFEMGASHLKCRRSVLKYAVGLFWNFEGFFSQVEGLFWMSLRIYMRARIHVYICI